MLDVLNDFAKVKSNAPCSMIMSISTYWNVKLHIAKQDKKRIDIIKCHLVLLWYKLTRWFMK